MITKNAQLSILTNDAKDAYKVCNMNYLYQRFTHDRNIRILTYDEIMDGMIYSSIRNIDRILSTPTYFKLDTNRDICIHDNQLLTPNGWLHQNEINIGATIYIAQHKYDKYNKTYNSTKKESKIIDKMDYKERIMSYKIETANSPIVNEIIIKEVE